MGVHASRVMILPRWSRPWPPTLTVTFPSLSGLLTPPPNCSLRLCRRIGYLITSFFLLYAVLKCLLTMLISQALAYFYSTPRLSDRVRLSAYTPFAVACP